MLQSGQICFDRFYLALHFDSNAIDFIHLHGFCDASLNAYGGCVYIVYQLAYGERFSRLVSAKSCIAPIRGETFPHLELLGALLLVRLIANVDNALS